MWVQYNKIFWKRSYSHKFYYSIFLQLFHFIIIVVNLLLHLNYKLIVIIGMYV